MFSPVVRGVKSMTLASPRSYHAWFMALTRLTAVDRRSSGDLRKAAGLNSFSYVCPCTLAILIQYANIWVAPRVMAAGEGVEVISGKDISQSWITLARPKRNDSCLSNMYINQKR